jgi:transposase-like protein
MVHKYAPISTYKYKRIISCFCLDLTATQTSLLLGINRNTVNKYFNKFRRKVYTHQLNEMRKFVGEIEVDESYFGPKRVKGKSSKRGRGTHRQPVFGIYERNGRVYTEIISDCKLRTLRRIITGKVELSSTIYSDSWKGYNGLVDVGFNKHHRINHKKDEFSNKTGVHINGIESFWSFTKRRLTKFNGVKKNFHLHLKECEWRWSKSPQKLESELLKLLKS